MNRNCWTVVVACAGMGALIAQPPPRGEMMRHGGPGAGAGLGMVRFGRDMKVVKGQPYSADVVSVTTQVLGDGTKIVKNTSGAVYRDSEGRTRREETGAQNQKFVSIFDPVAGVSYTLNPANKTASKSAIHSPAPGGSGHGHPGGPPAATAADPTTTRNGRTRVMEDLGTQTIEGVVAQGRRTTITIAAGTMGNDRDIKVVDETWIATDLHVIVQSHHSDPWTGDVTYKLSNFRRAEPAQTLFQAPADYQVQEAKFGHGGHPSGMPGPAAQQQ